MRSASNHNYVADGEVVLPAEVRSEVLVLNAAYVFLALLLVLIVPFFVSNLFFVPVLLLGKSRNHSSQQERGTNSADCCESLHDEPRLEFDFEPRGRTPDRAHVPIW